MRARAPFREPKRCAKGHATAALCLSLGLLGACSGGSAERATSSGNAHEPQLGAATPASEESILLADLSNDMLLPPEAPPLHVQMAPGQLRFDWSLDATYWPDNALVAWQQIWHHDELLGEEYPLGDRLGPDVESLEIDHALTTFSLADARFRLELCSAEGECISSRRIRLDVSRSASTDTLPAPQTPGASRAAAIALTPEGRMVFDLNAEAALFDTWMRPGDDWIVSDNALLDAIPESPVRTSRVVLAESNDTAALLTLHEDGTLWLGVLERLGEAWLLLEERELEASATAPEARLTLAIAADGEAILAGVESSPNTHELMSLRRDPDLWFWHEQNRLSIDANTVVKADSDLQELVWMSCQERGCRLHGAARQRDGVFLVNKLDTTSDTTMLTVLDPEEPLRLAASADLDTVLIGSWQHIGNAVAPSLEAWQRVDRASGWSVAMRTTLPDRAQSSELVLESDSEARRIVFGTADGDELVLLQRHANQFSSADRLPLVAPLAAGQSIAVSANGRAVALLQQSSERRTLSLLR